MSKLTSTVLAATLVGGMNFLPERVNTSLDYFTQVISPTTSLADELQKRDSIKEVNEDFVPSEYSIWYTIGGIVFYGALAGGIYSIIKRVKDKKKKHP